MCVIYDFCYMIDEIWYIKYDMIWCEIWLFLEALEANQSVWLSEDAVFSGSFKSSRQKNMNISGR